MARIRNKNTPSQTYSASAPRSPLAQRLKAATANTPYVGFITSRTRTRTKNEISPNCLQNHRYQTAPAVSVVDSRSRAFLSFLRDLPRAGKKRTSPMEGRNRAKLLPELSLYISHSPRRELSIGQWIRNSVATF